MVLTIPQELGSSYLICTKYALQLRQDFASKN